MTKVLLAVTLGALSALLFGNPAWAHNSLTGSTPEKGARVAEAPETITLRFLAKVNAESLTVTVTGPGGADAGGGAPRVKGSTVTVPWSPGAAGEYAVAYQLGSSDGHPIKGTVRFTLTEPAAGATAAPTDAAPTAAPSASAPAAVPTGAGPAPGALTAGEPDDAPVWPWLVGAAVLVAAGATGAALLLRRTPRP
ncbi:copper resistance CopC family protein [Spirilliplanes yamanashiensis]|nr:copper resistance CopC family protein [Spirilliplanes yamanashiensis]MDP9816639.1 methionine-rich copper-binding protein CopC [Spirilliplanes yamanashiensis]